LVILEPEKWIGHPFPLAEHLNPAIDVSTGRWIVVLHQHDCPKCQEAAPKYALLAENLPRTEDAPRVMLVEVSSHTAGHGEGAAYYSAKLTDEREWFVETPVEILLKDGAVEDVSTGLPSISDAFASHGI
jgi:hypothetical protein